MILNPKLLIVDDERGIVDMIQSYFQTQYDILTAYSGQEALKKVACKPDLILLDINMPGMDGLTVCQQIREHIACPILFLTARIESSDKIIGFQAGADDYIVKPFDLDELGARTVSQQRILAILNIVQTVSCILFPVGGLIVSVFLFYYLKLKQPISCLQNGIINKSEEATQWN